MRRDGTEDSNYWKLILLIGLLLAFPLAIVPFYPENRPYIPAFLIPSLLSIAIALAANLHASRKKITVTQWQSPLEKGGLPVMFTWCFAFFAGAMPFVIGNQLNFALAIFESISGWTTTGLTVMDVSVAPRIFLFHRAFMQFCGGLGFIIMIAMIVRNKQNMNLYSAEGHPDRLMPSLKKTSQTIFLLYSGFLTIGSMLYHISGMPIFDAICHTMSAISTAGFTTQASSIGQYDNIMIESITIVLMLVGATSFATLWLFVRGRFKELSKVSEMRLMLAMLLIFVPLAAFSLASHSDMSLGKSLMNSLFGIVTTFTTTGYSTMNYALWPPFALGLLMLLMILGGCAGSTAGGIKLLRAYLLIRVCKDGISSRFSPAQRVTVLSYYRAQGKMQIDQNLIKDSTGFVFCYLAVFIAGALLLTLTATCSLFDAMFEFASALGTVGISNGLTSADASIGTLIVLIVGMVLGRLEIYIVFISTATGIKMLKQSLSKS